MTQVLLSGGAPPNVYSRYATSNSTMFDAKCGAGQAPVDREKSSAFTSNFQRYVQGGASEPGVMQTSSNEINAASQAIIARNAQVDIHEFMKRRKHNGVSGFSCNFAPTLLTQARLHPDCGVDAGKYKPSKPAPRGPIWHERNDIAVRRPIGGAQMNEPAPQLYMRLTNNKMVSETHESQSGLGELPLIACRRNITDPSEQRGGTVNFGRIGRIEGETTTSGSYPRRSLLRERCQRDELSAARETVLNVKKRQLSGWAMNTTGFARGGGTLKTTVDVDQKQATNDTTFITTSQQAFNDPALVAAFCADKSVRKANTSYAQSRRAKPFIPTPIKNTRTTETPPCMPSIAL